MLHIDDLELIYKHLVKFFEKQGATTEESTASAEELILENANTLDEYHGLAYELGKHDMTFFCLYFLKDIYVPNEDNGAAPLAPIHYQIWEEIEDSIIGNSKTAINKGYILPRGTGKSAFGNTAPVAWCHAYGHRNYTMIGSATNDLAEKFVAQIKVIFTDNKRVESAFGTLLDVNDRRYKCNSTQLEFKNRTMVEAISSRSTMRGRKYNNRRPDLILLDDFQDTENDVRTEQARDIKWKRYSQDVKFAAQKPTYHASGNLRKRGTVFIALGTLQHSEDFYSRLMKQPTWQFRLERGVNVDDVDKYFNTGYWAEFRRILYNFKSPTRLEDAKEYYWAHESEMKFDMLWNEYWSCLDMAMSYYENPSAFKQEVQGDVRSVGEQWFSCIRTQSRERIEDNTFIKSMLLIDPASAGKSNSDFSAFLVGSLGNNDILYARHAELAKINARTEFDKYIDHAVDLLLKYPEITHVYMEKNTFNGADAYLLERKISEHDLLKFRNIEIINEMQKKNKDNKISTLIPVVNKGQIVFCEEDEDFTKQILDFRGQDFSVNDDAPDITAEFVNRIYTINVIVNVRILDRRKLGI